MPISISPGNHDGQPAHEYLTIAQAAAVFERPLWTVWYWIQQGKLPAKREAAHVPGQSGKVEWWIPALAVAARADELRQSRERAASSQQHEAAILQTLADGQLPRDLPEAVIWHADLLRRWRRGAECRRIYRTYLGAFLSFLEERGIPPAFSALTPRLVGQCQDWHRERTQGRRGGAVSEATLVANLRAFSRVLVDQGILDQDPLARLKRPHPPQPHRNPYTEPELSRMIDTATHGKQRVRDRALVLLLLDTGCRIGELCKAEVGDVDLDQGSITFRHTKNGRAREVLFRVDGLDDGGPCLAALREWLTVRTAAAGVHTLFTIRLGRPLRPHYARDIIARLGKAAGVVGPVIPHRFRHSAATQFLTQRPGAEIQLRARLGHLSHDVLATYVHITAAMSHDGATVGSVSSRLLAAAPIIPTPARSDMQVLIDAVRTDPELRKTLLQALLGAA